MDASSSKFRSLANTVLGLYHGKNILSKRNEWLPRACLACIPHGRAQPQTAPPDPCLVASATDNSISLQQQWLFDMITARKLKRSRVRTGSGNNLCSRSLLPQTKCFERRDTKGPLDEPLPSVSGRVTALQNYLLGTVGSPLARTTGQSDHPIKIRKAVGR